MRVLYQHCANAEKTKLNELQMNCVQRVSWERMPSYATNLSKLPVLHQDKPTDIHDTQSLVPNVCVDGCVCVVGTAKAVKTIEHRCNISRLWHHSLNKQNPANMCKFADYAVNIEVIA